LINNSNHCLDLSAIVGGDLLKAPVNPILGIVSNNENLHATDQITTIHSACSAPNIPLKKLTVITGPSGSGKSVLLKKLSAVAAAALNDQTHKTGELGSLALRSIDGMLNDSIQRSTLIDLDFPTIPGTGALVTAFELLNPLSQLYAKLPTARIKGMTANDFALRSGKLRCDQCNGEGYLTRYTNALPLVCDICSGSGYSQLAQEFRYRETALPDLLLLPLTEVAQRIGPIPAATRITQLIRWGLGYCSLASPLKLLNLTEYRRLILLRDLPKSSADTICFIDTPCGDTDHSDAETVLLLLTELTRSGATVVVAENHPVFATSDS
jgi:excinuclease ABC subunit A